MIDYDHGVYLVPLKVKNLETYRLARNEPCIRDWCRQTGEISQQQQERWFESQDLDKAIMMFEIHSFSKGLVGVCGLTDIDHLNRRAEFSLYIMREHQKTGQAKKALSTLLAFGFKELNLNMIWGESMEGNPAIKLFKDLGFQETGYRPDFYFKNGSYLNAYFYCIKADQWK